MRWTVWQRRTRCSTCGASISVPPTGLVMTCQYCGTEAPVPDIEQRAKQAGRAPQAPPRREHRGGRDAAHETRPSTRPEAPRGASAGRGLLKLALLLAVVGGVLHLTGTLDHLTEPLIGDDGRARYLEALGPLQRDGFVRLTQEQVERCFSSKTLYLRAEQGRQHALVLGGGQPFKAMKG